LPHVFCPERSGTVNQRLSIKVQEIEYSDFANVGNGHLNGIMVLTTWSGVMFGLGFIYEIAMLTSPNVVE
jgi:hypothetical protein